MREFNANHEGASSPAHGSRALTAALVLALVVTVLPVHAAELADPTRPPQGRPAPAEPAPKTPLKLDFVVNSRDRHLARINGEWVSEGDTVAGARVQRIDSDRVVVRRGGSITVLRLGGPGVRKNTTE
ncbi:hypothetical protein H0Z60_08890 [Ectothiorhodospiraceae bacterium WFHF3C12]|nr:hypothetical protein [Ectothiorhodospiraceae bacterium WFHF3C12]